MSSTFHFLINRSSNTTYICTYMRILYTTLFTLHIVQRTILRNNKIFYSDEDERALFLLQVNLFQHLKYLKNIFSIFLLVVLVLLLLVWIHHHKYEHIFSYIVDVFFEINLRMYHMLHIITFHLCIVHCTWQELSLHSLQ